MSGALTHESPDKFIVSSPAVKVKSGFFSVEDGVVAATSSVVATAVAAVLAVLSVLPQAAVKVTVEMIPNVSKVDVNFLQNFFHCFLLKCFQNIYVSVAK